MFFYIKFCFCVFYQYENKKREKCIANYLLIREFQMFFFISNSAFACFINVKIRSVRSVLPIIF